LYEALLPYCEPHFLPCSFGYRRGRSVPEGIAAVCAARDGGRRWVVDGDIRNCFDHIDRDKVLAMLAAWVPDRRLVQLTGQFLRARILNSASGGRESAGASQGSVLSPLLCNVYLHSFDVAMGGQPSPTEEGAALGACSVVRFADDFVLLTGRKREAEAARERAEAALRALKMELHPVKTKVIHFNEGFKFLGHFFLRGEVFPL
ncbi:MAG: reverse transcriptase domain-containing protein, partial [Ardenticatenaceae bacterium]